MLRCLVRRFLPSPLGGFRNFATLSTKVGEVRLTAKAPLAKDLVRWVLDFERRGDKFAIGVLRGIYCFPRDAPQKEMYTPWVLERTNSKGEVDEMCLTGLTLDHGHCLEIAFVVVSPDVPYRTGLGRAFVEGILRECGKPVVADGIESSASFWTRMLPYKTSTIGRIQYASEPGVEIAEPYTSRLDAVGWTLKSNNEFIDMMSLALHREMNATPRDMACRELDAKNALRDMIAKQTSKRKRARGAKKVRGRGM
jgi:hypothetical protein